ncbi:MAG: Imm1 family immunity protein [Caldilineaceae bacterium]|nr:Imm1 family immunity protein [Caldilineaceae bacterium]
MDKAELTIEIGNHSIIETVENVEELENTLRHAHKQKSASVYIVIPAYRNTMAIELDEVHGCIMFMDKSLDPPYNMLLEDPDAPDEDFEFDVGGTPTPIALKYCIPIEKVIDLARHFFLFGRFPEGIEWEET